MGALVSADLAGFLLARIVEDEAVARAAVGTAAFQTQTGRWVFEHVSGEFGTIPIVFAVADGGGKTQAALLETAWEREERGAHIARWDPARVLTECEAKRRIVELHTRATQDGHVCPSTRGEGTLWSFGGDPACDTLRLLALPYADHPDYRQEWKL